MRNSIVITIDGSSEDADNIAESLARMSLLDETSETSNITIVVRPSSVPDDYNETVPPQPSTPKSEVPDTTAIARAWMNIHEHSDDVLRDDTALAIYVTQVEQVKQAIADTGAVILMPGEIPSWMEPTRQFKPESGMKPSSWRLSPSTGEQS